MMPDQERNHDELRRLRLETGRRVRRLRHAHGYSPSALAREAQVPRSYVYDLEAGRRVTVRNVVAVAHVLKASTDYLLGLTARDERTHECCAVAADRDAWRRTAVGEALVQFPDGSWRGVQSIIQAHASVREAVTGERVCLESCGIYRVGGRRYRIGWGEIPDGEEGDRD